MPGIWIIVPPEPNPQQCVASNEAGDVITSDAWSCDPNNGLADCAQYDNELDEGYAWEECSEIVI